MRAASSPAAKRVQTKRVAAVIAAAMNFMMNSHHPHAWTTPVDVRTAGCAMAMFRRQTAAANSTIRKGSAVGPTRWRGASMPAVGLGRVGWPPVGFGARQQARRGPQAYCTVRPEIVLDFLDQHKSARRAELCGSELFGRNVRRL